MDTGSTLKAAWEIIRGRKSFKLDTPHKSKIAPPGVASNPDMEPVAPLDQTWGSSDMLNYWVCDLLGAGQWATVSSFVSIGLTWWEAVLATYVAGVFLSIIISINAVIGVRTHLPFAVMARSIYGWYFAFFAIASRIVVCWFWGSINTFNAGMGVTQCINAIWPSYANLPDHMRSDGLTSQSFLSFWIFWAIQLPFIFIHPKKLQWLMRVKLVLTTAVAIATLIVVLKDTHGRGSLREALAAKSTLNSAQGAFAFLTAVTAQMGSWITMGVNIGDFSRFCKKETSAYYQILYIPFLYTVPAIFGAISAQCSQIIYGDVLYQVYYIYGEWNKGSSARRFGAFFCSATFAFAQIGTDITGVTLPSATDLATIFPLYINIFRGSLIAITVGVFGFAPWKVLSSASNFVSFMGSYSVILAPIAAMLAADYFLVKKGKYNVPALYDPNGIYRYNTFGTNWRSLIAMVVTIGPVLPGMANSIQPSVQIGGARWIFAVADIWCLLIGAGSYWLLHVLFPPHEQLLDRHFSADDYLLERAMEENPRFTIDDEKLDKEGVVARVVEV